MEIVIKIPNNYDLSKIKNGSIASKIILDAVKNGTPLPKGHGRLIDADATIKEFGEWTDNWDEFAIGCLESAKTIIEADKEEDQ